MRVQDYVVDCAKEAAAQAFRYARAVPQDRLDWAPEGGRSIMNICRELAVTPTWTLIAFVDKSQSDWTAERAEALRQEQQQWMTVDTCEAEFNKRFVELEALFRGFTDEDLKKTKWLPYNGGRDHTFLEMMDYPRWNCSYHTGQIAYIQTLYGDKEDH